MPIPGFQGWLTVGLGLCLVQDAKPQVIRTEAQVVLVDVVASDKKGAYVRDLSASDFRVWEDGKEQKITSVTHEAGAGVPLAGKAGAGAVPSGPSARKNYMVLLFDNASMVSRDQALAHQTALKLMDTIAASTTSQLTAVVTFDGTLRVAQNFTEDVVRIKQVVSSSSSISGVSSNLGTNRLSYDSSTRDEIRALNALVRNLELVPGRKSLVWFTPGLPLSADYTSMVDAVVNAANRSNVVIYPVNMQQAETQGPSPGNGGGRVGPAMMGGRGGMGPLGGNPDGDGIGPTTGGVPLNSAALQAGLLRLAERTGGLVTRRPNDDQVLNKAVAEQGESYLLGYTPPSSPPGSCHKLRVEVTRKDVELRSRSEYCNRGELLSDNSTERTLEARALSPGGGSSASIHKAEVGKTGNKAQAAITGSMQATHFYTGTNVARVVAVMELDTASINFKKEKNLFQASLDVLGLAQKTDGSVAARFGDTKKFEFNTQAEVDGFKREPYRYEAQFDIAAGDYLLTVALGSGVTASGASGTFGTLTAPLRIDPYKSSDFAMSGIALSRQLRDPHQMDSALDELLVDDHKKLVTGTAELIPAGSPRLPASGQAGLFVEIYEPLLATAATRADTRVAIQLRVLDGAGAPKADTGLMRLDLESLSAGGKDLVNKNGLAIIPLLLSIPRTLNAGRYTLEIQAFDSADRSARRTIDFEIE